MTNAGNLRDEQIVRELVNVAVWRRGAERAPHKPLLLLLTLAKLQRGEPPEVRFTEEEEQLRELLRRFGPPRRAVHPEYPFWRLQRDGVWSVSPGDLRETSSGDVSVTQLRDHAAVGRLQSRLEAILRSRPALVNRIVLELLDAQWETSLHQEILDAIGFPAVAEFDPRPPRDPAFRETILRIYERRCAFCGYDARLAGGPLAIDAAHVRWHAAGGPDEPENGLALCSLHHRAFDRGALSIDDDHRILVSEEVAGGAEVGRTLLDLIERPVARPLPGNPPVALVHIAWHRAQVFRAPERRLPAQPERG